MKLLSGHFFLLLAFLFCFIVTPAANYFWVGGTGNWSDVTHWSNSSNGTFPSTDYSVPPTISDVVVFDASSFSAGGQTVTVDVDAFAGTLNFSGVTNSPTFTGANSVNLQISGFLTMDAGMTSTYNGDIEFLGTFGAGPFSITSAGLTIADTVNFNSTSADYVLADSLSISGELQLSDGKLDLAGFSVSAEALNCNLSTTNDKELDFNSSTVWIFGGGTSTSGNQQTVLDFRHDNHATGVLTLTDVLASLIEFNGDVEDVVLHLGRITRDVPALTFRGTTDDCIIFTREAADDDTKVITIGDITIVKDGADLLIDVNADPLQNGTRKVIGDITIPDNCDLQFTAPGGTGFGTGNFSSMNSLSVGDNVEANFKGAYIDILNNSTFGDRTSILHEDSIRYGGNITIGSTENLDFTTLGELRVTGTITTNATSTNKAVMFVNSGITVANVTIPDGKYLWIKPGGNVAHNITGNVTLGAGSTFLHFGANGTTVIGGNLTAGVGSFLETYTFNTNYTITGNVSLAAGATWILSSKDTTFISGTLTASSSCTNYIRMASTTDISPAYLNLTNVANLTGVIAKDIGVANAALNITNGQDGGNNTMGSTPVNFTTPRTADVFYWVGGIAAGAGDNLWSNADNWSNTSGSHDGNACLPGQLDTVIFDAASFAAGPDSVEVDVNHISVSKMDWSENDDNVTLDPASSDDGRTLTIYDTLRLDGQITNQYEGEFVFCNIGTGDATRNTITSAGVPFFGPVKFSCAGAGLFQLTDNLDVEGGERGDISLYQGRLDPNGHDISLEDDLRILVTGGRINHNASGAITATPFTLTFDGQNDNPTRQRLEILRANEVHTAFHNIVINRETNSIGDSATVVFVRLAGTGADGEYDILGDVTVTRGNLHLKNFILRDLNGTENFTMATNTFLSLERNAVDAFPTNFNTYSLHESATTRYFGCGDQIVSNAPIYGHLHLLNGGTKTVNAAFDMQSDLIINEGTTLDDAGFQITGDDDGTGNDSLIMKEDAVLIVGDGASNSHFPIDFNVFDISYTLGGEALVQYDGNGAQNVESIIGSGTSQYAKVEFNNGGIKTLLGSINVNTSLTINSGATLSNTGNYQIGFSAGNGTSDWISAGTGTYLNGTLSLVDFGGTAHNVSTGSVALAFTNMTVQCTEEVTLANDVEVEDVLNLRNGIVTTGANMINCTSVDAADIASYSNLSFVNGNLRKAIAANTSTYGLPVGNGTATTNYFLAEFVNNNLDGITALNVSVDAINAGVPATNADASLAGITQDGTLITSVVPDAQWAIDEVGARTSGSYGVRLYLENLTTVNATYDDYICPIKRDDGSTYADWATFDGTTTIPNPGDPGRIYNSGNGYVEKTGYETFSFHAVGVGINPLPIELVYFDAVLNEKGEVDLDWQTVTEINNDFFTLEKSIDGENFVSFSTVSGAGNSNDILNYANVDENPFMGVSYYRLKQTDFDGTYSYSSIVPITKVGSDVSSFLVYPNPSKQNGKFTIVLNGFLLNDLVGIRMVDMIGKEVYSRNVIIENDSNEMFSIELAERLAKGNYMLQVRSSTKLENQKVVIE